MIYKRSLLRFQSTTAPTNREWSARERIISRLLRHHCFEWLRHCSNTAALCCAKNRRCESSRVTAPLEKLLRNTLVFYIVYHAAKSESILVSMKQNS